MHCWSELTLNLNYSLNLNTCFIKSPLGTSDPRRQEWLERIPESNVHLQSELK